MKTKFSLVRCLAIITVAFCLIESRMHALPIHVTYAVSGTPGDYDVSFTVENNMPDSGQSVYFWGIQLGSVDGIENNGFFNGFSHSYNSAGHGGSGIEYDWAWEAPPPQSISQGTSLSGFNVHVTSALVPSSVKWFAFSLGGPDYLGGDNYYLTFNPGFEGTAELDQQLPETGMTLPLLGLALLGLTGMRRKWICCRSGQV